MQKLKKAIAHAQIQIKQISMLSFSGCMYREESGNVSFFLYLYELLCKCNLIRIKQFMKTD